jgi:hypothetical protein
VTKNSATLTGVVYPNDEATTWYFQWGITGYEYQTFGGTVPAGTAAQEVSDGLYGLQSGLIFHYRLVVQHGSTAVTPGGDAFFETYPSPRPRPRIFAASTPRRARTPATFTTSGRLRGPSYTPSSLQCTGNVRVTYYLGRRVERRLLAPVQPSCTFAATATFKRLPGRGPKHRSVRLTVRIRFLGNHYLAPASARRETVTLR